MSAEKKTNAKQREDVEDFDLDEATRYLLLNSHGRCFLWWILEQCGIYRSSLGANSAVYSMEGERNVGLKIIAQLNHVDETAYPQLMFEVAKDRRDRRAIGEVSNHDSGIDDE